MKFLKTKCRNVIWKSVNLLPLSYRLKARCQLKRWNLSDGEPEWREVASLGPNHGTALDIGANHGLWSFELARLYDKVVAFEPNEHITSELVAAGSPKIQIVHAGLSDTRGQSTLHIPFDRNGNCLDGWSSLDPNNLPDSAELVERPIPIETIDSMDVHNVRFIKLDVEGHEISVAKGARKTLKRDQPVVVAEVRTSNLAEFTQLMEEAGLVRQRPIDGGSDDMYLFGPPSDPSIRRQSA